jgi:hypothetical protein
VSFQLDVFDFEGEAIQLGLDHGLVADVVFPAHVLQRQLGLEAQEVFFDALPAIRFAPVLFQQLGKAGVPVFAASLLASSIAR